MADRFGKFTERARQVLFYAQQEAREHRHNYIGTEHQLLGLIRVEEGLGAKALIRLGVEPEQVRTALGHILRRGNQLGEGEIGLTPRAKKVMELAVDEARRLNHHYIGTEHLLLGLVREGEGIAADVLKKLGVTLDEARAKTMELLGELPAGTGGPPSFLGSVAQWMGGERGVKRYNLALPESLYADVQALADRQQTTVVELLRRFIKLGLLATEIQERPEAALIIREGEKEREILLL